MWRTVQKLKFSIDSVWVCWSVSDVVRNPTSPIWCGTRRAATLQWPRSAVQSAQRGDTEVHRSIQSLMSGLNKHALARGASHDSHPLPMFTIEDSAGTASVLSAAISNELCVCILIFVSFLSLSISLLFFSGSFSACIFSHTVWLHLPKCTSAFSQKSQGSQVKRQWETERCAANNCFNKHN